MLSERSFLNSPPNRTTTTATTRLGMTDIQDLRDNGYLVLYDAVPDVVTDHLRSMSRERENYWIHYTTDGKVLDEHRLRSTVPDPTSQSLSDILERHIGTLFPNSTATEWSLLKTVAGASDQLIHRDFTPEPTSDPTDVCSVPASIFLPTQGNAYLFGFGWNTPVAMKSQRVLIKLSKGDLLLIRGDFIYDAVGYDTNNVVVHGYLDMSMYQRPIYSQPTVIPLVDDTRGHIDTFCFVLECPFVGSDDNSLRKHLNRYHHIFSDAITERTTSFNEARSKLLTSSSKTTHDGVATIVH